MRFILYTALLPSLLVLLPRTSVRAQLQPDAPSLTWLADHLGEMGHAGEIPNGDFGPTLLARTRNRQLWQPGGIGADWRGFAPAHTGVGNFTAYGHSSPWDRRVHTAFATGEDQYALRLYADPFSDTRLSVGLSRFSDRRSRDADQNGRNDLTNRTATNGYLFSEWRAGNYDGRISIEHLQDDATRNDVFSTDQQRTLVSLSNNFRTYGPRLFSTVNYLRERSERRFQDRLTDASRNTASLQLGIRDEVNRNRIGYSASVIALHREDDLVLPGLQQRVRERFVAVNGTTRYDVSRFRLRYHQQLRFSDTDGTLYRPNLMISWFPRDVDLSVTALANRGGGYRSPVLAEEHLSYTLRNHATSDLRSEDFWRGSLTVRGSFFGDLDVDLQAFALNYQRYTAVRYGPEGTLSIDQAGGASRRLAVAQVNYTLPFIHLGGYGYPSLILNYRYDNLRPDNPEGVLLPARHAAWLRLRAPVEFGHRSDWKLVANLGYLLMSPVTGLTPDATSNDARNRLDASVRVQFKTYWLALRGEQLLRNEPLFAHGTDPLGGAAEIPLGNEQAALAGRRFTVAVGVRFWDN